jgi:hypothetical protein
MIMRKGVFVRGGSVVGGIYTVFTIYFNGVLSTPDSHANRVKFQSKQST